MKLTLEIDGAPSQTPADAPASGSESATPPEDRIRPQAIGALGLIISSASELMQTEAPRAPAALTEPSPGAPI